MNDIENMLSKHIPKPKRSLRNNFTEAVVSEVRLRLQPNVRWQLLPALRVRLLSKVGIASVVGAVVVSGTVAAFALWPVPKVTPTVRQALPSGNHIVGYDTQNCNYFDELKGGPVTPTDDKLYYEVRKGSSLTDTQLQTDLQATCETKQSNTEISSIVNQHHWANLPGMMSTDDYIVQAISDGSITVKLDPHYNTSDLTTIPVQTYTHFTSSFLVYDESNISTYNNLKVGDEITMAVQDTSGKSAETSENYNPLNYPNTITILAIVRVPNLTADPGAFDRLVGTTLVRVEKCKTSPTGFCRVYNFVK